MGTAAASIAAIALLMGSATADATSAQLRPISDHRSGWTPVQADATWEAIDDQIRVGRPAAKKDRIKARSGGPTTVVNLDSPTIPEGEIPTELTAHFYARTGKRTELEIELSAGGIPVSNGSLAPRTSAGWYAMDTTGSETFDLDELQLSFRASGKRKAQVRAAYAELTTTGPGEPPVEEPPVEEPPVEEPPIEEPPVEEPPADPNFRGDVSIFGSTTTIRPDKATPAGGANKARLVAAQNEFESFQVVVEATDGPVEDLEMQLSAALRGPGGATIAPSNVTIYREEYYEVSAADGKPRSSRKGGEGLWPDALIPERDPYYGENRAAFPVDVRAGGKMIAWIDVFVPANAVPGAYNGKLRLTSANGGQTEVDITTQVSSIEMPSTSTLASAFLKTPPGYFPCKAHRNVDWCHPEEEDNWKLDYLYTRAALENRMTIPNAMPGAYGQAPTSPHFEEYMLPLIKGTDNGGIDGTLAPRLGGAELTSVTAMWQCVVEEGCLEDWRSIAQEHGFGDKFFAYVCDEPFDQDTAEYWNDWRDCSRNARTAKQAWPGVQSLVTSTIQGAKDAENDGKIDVQRDIDILSAPVNYMANRPDNPQVGDQTGAYDNFLSQSGNEMWMYTACPQFSCDEHESSYFDGWPSYAIDQPASQARAMGWISFLYGSTGELYHNTTLQLDTAWDDQYAFGGNGDGTLFYPGSPEGYRGAPAIGGQHDIPIESIRMKRIREGREDYELLKALGDAGRMGQATTALTGLLGSRDTAMYSTDVSQGSIDNLRCTLMIALDPTVAPACI